MLVIINPLIIIWGIVIIFIQKDKKNSRFLKIVHQISIKWNLMDIYQACSSVDRASDSDSGCQGFDSLHAYKLKIGAVSVSTFNNEKIQFRWKLVFFLKIYKKLLNANNIFSFNFTQLISTNTKLLNKFSFA